MPLLEEVFTLSGIPTHTFVEPARFDEIKVSVRTQGRCLVIEGPSGIGKTTMVTKAIAELGLQDRVLALSARKPSDAELIAQLPNMEDIGIVLVDDFHRLSDNVKASLSDFMKVLADSGSETSKLILIGINKAGQQLVKFAHDLGLRIDVFRLETNSIEKILELISLGNRALNIKIEQCEMVADRAQGSFQIAQFKERFGERSVIPVRFSTAKPGVFSNDQKYGGLPFDPAGDVESQLQRIAEVLSKRLIEDRQQNSDIDDL